MVRLGTPIGLATLASVLAVLAVPGVAGASDGVTTPATTPCEAAGAVAILEPDATEVTLVGPSVSAADRTGVAAPAFADDAYGLSLADAAVGAAGCVGAGDPGGASTRLGAFSLFGGAVAGASLQADLVPQAAGWYVRRKVTGLTVAGAPVDPQPGAVFPVSTWGTLEVGGRLDGKTVQPFRWWAAAFLLRLTKPHAGLPAGTVLLIGYAGAATEPLAPAPPPAVTTTTTANEAPPPPPKPVHAPKHAPAPSTTTAATHAVAPPKAPKAKTKAKAKKPRRAVHKKAKPKGPQPLKGTPPLAPGVWYVFPIDGHADWGDSYGGERSDVPGGWHHGDDLFAPLGTPVVAVSDGTIFAVGWNRVGGWRLWLLDPNGNQFYYAHLSGYTGLATDGAEVRKGQVLGFVGNTGDAVTTWPHLHFEVHPSSLLYLGYDGAVDPTTYLRSFPLARNVVVPPPVALPGKAPPGRGAAMDFRRLLAVHPLHKAVKAKPVSLPTFHPHGYVYGIPEGGAPASAVAAAPVTARAAPAAGGGAALLVGILIGLGGIAAIAYTALVGRSSSERGIRSDRTMA